MKHALALFLVLLLACACIGAASAEAGKLYLHYIGGDADFEECDNNVPRNILLHHEDLRDRAERDRWRSDTRCVDPAAAGDQLLPSYSKGNPDIPQSVYDGLRAKLEAFYEEEAKKKETP